MPRRLPRRHCLSALRWVVNNAGHAQTGRFEDLSDDIWIHDWQMKFLGPAQVVREASPWMLPGGRILNISAVFGKQPHPDFFASSVTRASTLAWTKALSKAWAPRGVRVNAINIGFVYSEQWAGRPPEFFAGLVSKFQVPLGRFGSPEEVVPMALLLVSPRSSYITGAVVDVDGGLAQYL
jgi:3-oxoacyl-[acyl-carrier protein] reductase